MRLIFIRHGDPDYERDNLTEKGQREAELLSKRVALWNVKDFYSSPLGRAKATADIALKETGRSYEILPWAKEFHYLVTDERGKRRIPWDFYPHEWTKYEENFIKNKWAFNPVMQSGDIAAHYKEVSEGIDGLLEKYGLERFGDYYKVKKHTDDTIVIFCHFGVTMVSLSHLLNISAQTLLHGMFTATTSVTVLNSEERFEDEAYFRCQTIGDTRHLYEGGEPISQSGYFAPLFQD